MDTVVVSSQLDRAVNRYRERNGDLLGESHWHRHCDAHDDRRRLRESDADAHHHHFGTAQHGRHPVLRWDALTDVHELHARLLLWPRGMQELPVTRRSNPTE
jgi:hypothetical protein